MGFSSPHAFTACCSIHNVRGPQAELLSWHDYRPATMGGAIGGSPNFRFDGCEPSPRGNADGKRTQGYLLLVAFRSQHIHRIPLTKFPHVASLSHGVVEPCLPQRN